MTEEEARAILKAHGWGYLMRKRKGLPYIYAVRREKHIVKEHYIGPLSRLPDMTEAEMVAKLAKKS